MENKSREHILELFSQILLENQLPQLDQLTNMVSQEPTHQGIGPLVSDKEGNYSFDLRPIHSKGSLSYLHPVYVKSILLAVTEFHTPISSKIIDLSKFSFYESLKSKFKNICISPLPTNNFKTYSLKKFHKRERLEYENIYLDDLLFSSNIHLFDLDVLKQIDTDHIYLDLGIGIALHLGEKDIPHYHLNSFHASLTNPFFTFIDNILLNKGEGRIAQINKLMDCKDSYGLNFKIDKNKNLSDLPILMNKVQDFINIPSSILDDHIKYLKSELYGP
jgi:hypothetical protein